MSDKKQFSYDEKEVTYENKSAGITLAGTFTAPSSAEKHPAVLLVSGMGAMDRDGTFYGHKPMLMVADYLTKHGICVLRFDKRGVGKSTGTFDLNVTSNDLANDVLAGIEYLKTCPEVNTKQIGLIGFSEGGFISSMVASRSKDVSFIALMSGAVANDIESMVEQSATQLRFDGASPDIIEKDGAIRKQVLEIVTSQTDALKAEKQLRELLDGYWNQLTEQQKSEANTLLFAFSKPKFDAQISTYNSPWYRFYLGYTTTNALSNISVPVLAINGEFDFMPPRLIFPIIRNAMNKADNKDHTLLELPNLNHAMKTCKTGSIAEYATLEEAISPRVLQAVTDWIIKRTITAN
ncbi:alpha/beta fold hydrolase [Candidatus Dependentiae bacterium]|nr:alpha/beta fold hydrolase [Candidatus Dependentiae bacterium]